MRDSVAFATPKASTPWPGMQDKLDMLVLVLVQTSRPQRYPHTAPCYTVQPHTYYAHSHTHTRTHTHTHTHTHMTLIHACPYGHYIFSSPILSIFTNISLMGLGRRLSGLILSMIPKVGEEELGHQTFLDVISSQIFLISSTVFLWDERRTLFLLIY